MKNLLFLLFALLAFSCQKEETEPSPTCTPDSLGKVEIFNNHDFPVKITVRLSYATGGFGNGETYQLAGGGTWEKNLTVGKYQFRVEGNDGNAPYASDSVDFSVIKQLSDCETTRIEP